MARDRDRVITFHYGVDLARIGRLRCLRGRFGRICGFGQLDGFRRRLRLVFSTTFVISLGPLVAESVVVLAEGGSAGAGAAVSATPVVTPSRVLIVLKALTPATATMCSTSTMSRARDNLMFGSDISS